MRYYVAFREQDGDWTNWRECDYEDYLYYIRDPHNYCVKWTS